MEDKGFQYIFGDCWQHFGLLLLSLVLVSFFCSAPCCFKFFLMENTHKTTKVQGEEFFTLLLLTTLCLVSLTLEFGSILFFQFFCFVPCCFNYLLIEGTHKTMKVQREEQSTSYFWQLCVLGLLLWNLVLLFFFEFFCFAPCLNCLSWFKILGKVIHDSTL